MSEVQAEEGGAHRHARGERGLMLAAISNVVVRIHKQFYGKGPIKARTHLADSVLVVRARKGVSCAASGPCANVDRPRSWCTRRLAMQSSIEPELRAAIETELRRPVRSLMNAVDPNNELEVVVCVLASGESETPGDVEVL